jgi:phospholipase C
MSTALLSVAPAVQAATTTTGATAPASFAWAAVKADNTKTVTPIKHLVVIFDENVSFDHYFATYPNATNPEGEPSFTARAHTPAVNNLATANLLTNNPNFTNTANGTDAAEPFRLDRTQASTADQNHAYTAEEQAYDNGLADLFPKYTGTATAGGAGAFGTKGQVMGYYDGNTVTALWNYAQHFSMNDNMFTDTYGPSTPGALEVISGQTNGLQLIASSKSSYYVSNSDGSKTLINDVDPGYDVCSSTTNQAMLTGKNVGDLLNSAGITWGGFMGGFNLGTTNGNGTTGCGRSTMSTVVGAATADYIPHHNWFQYYASTANPTHARPASLLSIGYSFDHNGAADPANHQYDLQDFYNAVNAGNFPSVSYIKLPAYQDGHAGYSDPLDEQAGLVKVINFLEQQPDWKNTAIIVTWDDSDGWYDHDYATPSRSSSDSVADQLNGAGSCGTGTHPAGLSGQPVNGRCGPGTRMPFLLISSWARPNYVSHGLLTQASVVNFIEDNWMPGKHIGSGSFDVSVNAEPIMSMLELKGTGNTPKLLLNPTTGEVLK